MYIIWSRWRVFRIINGIFKFVKLSRIRFSVVWCKENTMLFCWSFMLLKGWRIAFCRWVKWDNICNILATSGRLEIVCPLKFRCFIGCLTFIPCILWIILQTFRIGVFLFILVTNDCHDYFLAVHIVRRAWARLMHRFSKFVMVIWRRKLCKVDLRSFIARLQSSLIQDLLGLVF